MLLYSVVVQVAVSRDFLAFFYFIYPTHLHGLLENRLKLFLLNICFPGDIREISDSDSAQANTARSQTLRRLTLRIVKLLFKWISLKR